MSYAVRGERSDVYLVRSSSTGQIECLGCALATSSSVISCETLAHVLAHLEEHRKHGQQVPKGTIVRLTRELLESWQIAPEALTGAFRGW